MLRDIESYNHHLSNVVGQCCKSWVVLKTQTLLGIQYLLIPKSCKSNFCPKCRRDNLLRLRKAMFNSMKKDKWRLCTLTFPDHTKNIEEAIHESYKMFKRLCRQLRKLQPQIKYIRSIEVHKSGFIHIHCVFNQYIPILFIQEKWKEVGGGIVDIRSTKKCNICHKPTPCEHSKQKKKLGYRDAAKYLTEEMEKQEQDPHRLGFILWKNRVRTIATSRNVKLVPPTEKYEFVGNYHSLYDAYELFQKLEDDAAMSEGCEPAVRLGNQSVTFGPDGHYRNNGARYDLLKPTPVLELLRKIDRIRNDKPAVEAIPEMPAEPF